MPAKIIDIGEWKKAHGLAPVEPPQEETSTEVFVNRFLEPEGLKNLFTVKRPTP